MQRFFGVAVTPRWSRWREILPELVRVGAVE
jgi:hypothetical protein